ncbi:hypothetical protein Poli38472_011946 [Pythium oligandrum]|uniref:Cyclic nucleotide-binding domain-containing protein n=1 Tax=Pythium oligandrum TaxID=41045 RepID=A0A8K1CQF2_PYTOL|nr:hypothetical protein Poli38472_011946 [Pythium oligandrum]|eukprot:TMW66830.1 hypothetical protein Poli38472_011946 [Pythium oligandrum]
MMPSMTTTHFAIRLLSMKAFLPARTPRANTAVASSNATFLSSKAAAEAARATTAAATELMSRSMSSAGELTTGSTPLTARLRSTRGGLKRIQSRTLSSLDPNKAGGTARSSTAEPGKPTQPEDDDEVFPSWIRERKDFQVFFPRYADRVITDEEILRQGVPKEPNERNIVELQSLARWIMKIPSMQASLDLGQATEIAKMARYQIFKPRDYIFRKGDRGDACYLVFSGEVHVLIDGQKVAAVGKNAAFGDIALQIENATRGADVQAAFTTIPGTNGAITGVEVLKIMAEDYHKTLARCQSRRRKHLISWLHSEVAIFRDCAESKLHFFELVSIDVPLKKGDVLYHQGDSVGAFYIVRSGRIRMEVDIEYEHRHRWPSGAREWKEKVHTVKSRVPFYIEDSTGFFGFEMFVDGQQTRAYTAIAESANVELIALNRVDCFSPYFSFTPRAIDKIMEKHDKCCEMSVKQIHQKLKDFHRQENQQKRSLRPVERFPVVVQPRFDGSGESPQFQFPCLQASKWEASNDVVRALQLACQ